MINSSHVDPKTLKWVKEEVENALVVAKDALEAYIASPNYLAKMRICIEQLHTIRGAIEMVELYGAGLLAEELEEVAFALSRNDITQTNEAYDVLIRGMLQLPAYLENLYQGNRDIPLVLLPLLNDMRAVQDKALLTESAFFSPDVSASGLTYPVDGSGEATWDLQTIAKRLRSAYLTGLLSLLKEKDVINSIKKLATVISNLEQSSTIKSVATLWWVCSGVIYSLYDKGLTTNISIKILLGRVDQQIKKLIEEGEVSLAADPPTELIKNMLYYVASSTSKSKRVQKIKAAFRLDDLLPDQNVLNQTESDLLGHNAHLMNDIAQAIKEELLKIKDELSVFNSTEGGAETKLSSIIDKTQKVSDALGMLGLGQLRILTRSIETFIGDRINNHQTLTEEDSFTIAGKLLVVESYLNDLGRIVDRDLKLDDGELSSIPIPEPEYKQIVKKAAEQSLTELNKIKEKLSDYFIGDGSRDVLTDVPASLHELQGVTEMLSYDIVADMLQSLELIVSNEFIENGNFPDEQTKNRIADVVVGVEYFLEGLLEKSVAPEAVLEIARESLNELGYEIANPVDIDVTPAITASSESTKPLPSKTMETPVRVADDVPEFEDNFANADKELVDVFLSEADEEFDSILENLELWKSNQENRDSLENLMRSFHTLKGGGRIVGAPTLGLLAWSIEDILRRVIEGTVEPSTAITDLVGRSVPALKEIKANLAVGQSVTSSAVIQSIITGAKELRQAVHA